MYVGNIVKASFHRNGISGEGFYAVLFENASDDNDLMIASLFDAPGYCAVYSVKALGEKNIEFACGNSYRGDVFEEELRPKLKEWFESNGINRIGPFAL